jgi:hypothetical protein
MIVLLYFMQGREIKTQTRFFSMPEMADLESLLW